MEKRERRNLNLYQLTLYGHRPQAKTLIPSPLVGEGVLTSSKESLSLLLPYSTWGEQYFRFLGLNSLRALDNFDSSTSESDELEESKSEGVAKKANF